VLLPLTLPLLLLSGAPADEAARALWDAWPSHRFVKTPAPCLRPPELAERLRALEARHPGGATLEEVGRSVEGRPVHLLTVGHGPRRVLLWSQMHGDEPSATPALLDVADTLLSGGEGASLVLDRLTLLMVPMLNPDGAARYTRRNAQAIDVNRDALALATPEGRLLKALRDRFSPELGFNLHDQDRRTTVGDTGTLATIALLAVAGDAAGTLTPGRARAKRVCAEVARTLAPFVPGGISRYDEDWNPRAFGDNLTAWGTPVALIENGGVPPGLALTDLTRLDYVALLTVLQGLARDDLAGVDPALYESLERNADDYFVDALVAGGQLWQPPAPEPYRADLGFDLGDDDPEVAGCPDAKPPQGSAIREVGDGRLLKAALQVDATGRLVVPALAASIRGFAAREWLSGGSLAALARLGVARLRWHVDPAARDEATAFAGRLAGAGRPAIEVVSSSSPPHFLVVDGPPAEPGGRTLEACLDALTGGSWAKERADRALGTMLGVLAGQPEGPSPPEPPLRPDAEASLLVLRPLGGPPDFATVDLEAVFVDGREPPPARR
jgi:hypothetical protein